MRQYRFLKSSIYSLAILVGTGGLISTSTAQAQTVNSTQDAAVIAEPGPESLIKARALIDLIMPPAQRESMVNDMVLTMMKNLTGGLMQEPKMQSVIAEHPKMETIFENFIDRQQTKALAMMQKNLPGMITAMQRAYARQFTVQQLEDITVFFATPTGQVYARNSTNIMADPDVAAWQRNSMQESMAALPAEINLLMAELKAASMDDNNE